MDEALKTPNFDLSVFRTIPTKLLNFVNSLIQLDPEKRKGSKNYGSAYAILQNGYSAYRSKKLIKAVEIFDKEEMNKIYLKAKSAIYMHYMSKYIRDSEIEDLYSVYKNKKIDEVNDKPTLLIFISETLVARIVKDTK